MKASHFRGEEILIVVIRNAQKFSLRCREKLLRCSSPSNRRYIRLLFWTSISFFTGKNYRVCVAWLESIDYCSQIWWSWRWRYQADGRNGILFWNVWTCGDTAFCRHPSQHIFFCNKAKECAASGVFMYRLFNIFCTFPLYRRLSCVELLLALLISAILTGCLT